MCFEIIGELSAVETIAPGSGIRELARLRKFHGRGRWRKRKGVARVRLIDGVTVLAELHWHEATADAQAAKHGQLRVVDESGEDYLYPEEFFLTVELPQSLRRRVLQAA